MQINFKQCKCSDANSRETAHQLQNPSRPPLASLTLHNDSGSNNTLLEISKKLDRTETAVHNQMTRWINRGGYDLNDPTDSSSESDGEEAWQRMAVTADEKMHFTKRQSKK
ncbi:uncharacterized protein [Bemisia tabaci]|uniref:uncharacterized protein isoform X2 n=1 Tax=Bemisia tabaci TaxID=7038 RepID=UPI003B281594